MNIAVIKTINEKMPYWMKKPFASAIRNRLIKNKVFLDTYQNLIRADSMNSDEKREKQKELLINVLKHAYDHSSYYHSLFDRCCLDPYGLKSVDEIEKLPILTKEVLKTQYNNIVADDIGDSYEVTTGGTTGEPTKLQMERDAIYREWAFIYHYWSKYGYDYNNSHIATFRGIDMQGRISEINPLYAEIRLNPFILCDNNIDEYISRIRKYKADFIYGYPSAIYNFCRIVRKKGLNISGLFRGALFISENLYEFQETLIKEVLQCPMVLFYGHSERSVFAERYTEGYIFNPLYGFTEFSEDGKPIVTGFINQKTPLIRYLVDDHVKPVCGKNGIYSIEGHHDTEVLYGFNGEQISFSSINFHDDTFNDVIAYQFIQNEIGVCDLLIVPDSNFNDKRVDLIKKRVNKKLGDGYACSVKIVGELTLSNRGKHRMIIQNIMVQ